MTDSTDDGLFQNSVYVGINLQDILYGAELVLYFTTLNVLVRKRTRTNSDVFYALFSSAMLVMITIWVSTQALFGQKMWLLDDDFPGGPGVFWARHISVWYMDLATIALIVLQLMTDALMIYRCWMIWQSTRAIAFPLVLWIGTFGLGIFVAWTSSASGGIYFRATATDLCLAYYAASVFLTALLSSMICYRMVLYAHLMRQHLGQRFASPYRAVVALVVETVLPYSLSGVMFLVALGAGSTLLAAFGYVHAMMMCVSPQLLILRVALGKSRAAGGAGDKGPPPSSVQFSPEDGGASASSGFVSQGSDGLEAARKEGESMV